MPSAWQVLAWGYAAAHHADPLGALRQLGGQAQGAHEILNVVALVQVGQQLGGQTHLLEDNSNGALLPVIVGDGQRDALPLLIQAQDDKLPGPGLLGNERGLYLQQGDAGVEYLFPYDLYHVDSTSSSLRSVVRPFLGRRFQPFQL